MSTSKEPDPKPSSRYTRSITKTTESGAFIRTIYREGKTRKQTTQRIKPNMKKVILGGFGEFEVYVYPFDYPDKVFIGKFPVSTYVSAGELKNIRGLINIMAWFLDGQAFNEATRSKAANSRRRAILSAYDLALNELQSKKQAAIKHNYNYTINTEIKQP